MMRKAILAGGLVLAGCAGAVPQGQGSAQVRRQVDFAAAQAGAAVLAGALRAEDTGRLCTLYTAPRTSEPVLLAVEAELALRDDVTCAGAARSAARVGVPVYPRREGRADHDCADFARGARAQVFFLAAGGPARDPHGLDADGDGLACEWGVERDRLWAPPAPPVSAAPRRSGSGRCHVGPRGGTYTITSGGNKNYSGC
jgi:hypothetical protein